MRFIASIFLTIPVIVTLVTVSSAVSSTEKENVQNINRKNRCKWNDELETRLLHIWKSTNPYKRYHGNRIEKEWKNQPDLPKLDGGFLRRHAYDIIHRRKRKIINVPIEPKFLEKNTRWNEKDDKELAEIFQRVDGDPAKIYQEWISKNSRWQNIDFRTLHKHVMGLVDKKMIQMNEKVMDKWRPKHYQWKPDEVTSLMKIWYKIYQGSVERDYPLILQEWQRQNWKSDRMDIKKLKKKVTVMLEKGFIIPPEHPGGVSIKLDKSIREERNEAEKYRQLFEANSHYFLPISILPKQGPSLGTQNQHLIPQKHTNLFVDHQHNFPDHHFSQQHDEHGGGHSHLMNSQSQVNQHYMNHWRETSTASSSNPYHSNYHYVPELDIHSEHGISQSQDDSSFYDNFPSPQYHFNISGASSPTDNIFDFDWRKLK